MEIYTNLKKDNTLQGSDNSKKAYRLKEDEQLVSLSELG